MNPIVINLAITALTPVVIYGVKALVPKIPKLMLPMIAPVIGVALSYLGQVTGTGPDASAMALVYGGLGVWLREVVDQVKNALGIGKPTTPAV